jgi:Werner syndrome ATP-dependent helicase
MHLDEAQLPMVIKNGPWKSARPWLHAKLPKNNKGPAWAESANRFAAGESIVMIALSKGVLPSTVSGHILESMLHGREINLGAFAEQFLPPNQRQWQLLEEAAFRAQIDPVNTPSFIMKDLLMQVDGMSGYFTAEGKARDDLSPHEQGIMNSWYNHIKWWQTLKRCDFSPDFGPAGEALDEDSADVLAKRQRV